MTWGRVLQASVMPRVVEVGPHPWDCLRGILGAPSHGAAVLVGAIKSSYWWHNSQNASQSLSASLGHVARARPGTDCNANIF